MLAKVPTVFVSGGSRGIGLAVALRLAKEGANVTIAAKTATPHPKLPGTIYTAAEDIEKAGGTALPLVVDIRNPEDIEQAVAKTVSKFGGIDIVINNASAISLTDSQKTSVKTYDLMNNINARGTYLVTKFAVPHLLNSAAASRNPHILTFAPPLLGNLQAEVFGPNTAYAMAKFGMSLGSLGFAGELKGKVGSNCLWPLTYISTEAIRLIMGEKGRSVSRNPTIMADAAFAMLNKDGSEYSGNFEIDEIFLRKEKSITTKQLMDLYSPGMKLEDLQEDLFIPDWVRSEIKTAREHDAGP